MARLLDDIRATGKLQKPWWVPPSYEEEWAKHTGRVAEILNDPQLPVLLIDNVADYYYRASDQEFWNLTEHFPNLAPPFPQFWSEHKMPRVIHSKEYGDTDMTGLVSNGRIGALITALNPGDWTGQGIPEETRWILWAEIFLDYGQRGMPVQGSHSATFFALNGAGQLLGTPWTQAFADTKSTETAQLKCFISFYHPTLLAVCFLHCKNVKIVEETVDKPLAKKYRERTGIQPTPYKTLVIEPLKQILRTEGRSGEVGIQRAMHICRGHFADYTDGKGLFGKYHGRFWIPATVRGTKRGGEKPPAREIEVRV